MDTPEGASSAETAHATNRRSARELIHRARGSQLAGAIAVGLLVFLSLGAWGLSSAPGSNPDADYHLTSIWCTDATGADLCAMEERRNQKMVPSQLPESRCYAQFPEESAACQPMMTTLDGRETMTNRLNSVQQLYPTGFYRTLSTMAGSDIEASVVGMRLFNAGLFVTLNAVLWWILPLRLRGPLVWAWAGTLVPLASFIIPSTNPSSWAIIGVGSAWVALLGYLEGSGWRRWTLGAMFVGFVGIGSLARTDATLFAVATSGVALLATDASFREVVRRLWIPAVLAVVGLTVLLFQFGVLNRILSGFGRRESGSFDWGLLWNNIIETPGLWMGSFGTWPWGALGWLDTPMPQIVAFGAFGVFIALLGAGLAGASVRIRLVTLLMFLLIWTIPVYLLQVSNFLVGLGFQSRYGLPLIAVLLGILLLRPEGHPGIFTQRTPLVMVVVALSVANSIALHHNIRRYVTGLDERGFNLNADGEWWWQMFDGTLLTPMTVWSVGSLAFFAAAWVALVWGMARADRVSGLAETTAQSEVAAR